jgi:molybdate transport system permease protein
VNLDVWWVTGFTIVAALSATVLMAGPGIGLAWLLARREFPFKSMLEVAITLPLVVPPVATGLLLLLLVGHRGPIGRLLDVVGIEVVFTWKAVVLAMAVMGLPLLVRTARAGFEQVNPRYEQVASSLGAGPGRVFLTMTLPLAGRSIVAGAILAFARALGEFGATIMVAGNIPGRTRTLAVAIYGYAETGQDAAAARLLIISVAVAFVALWFSNRLLRDRPVAA